MNLRIGSLRCVRAFLMIGGLAISTGCAPKPTLQALFTKPELLGRIRLAVLGLTPEQEQIFMASYTKAFPGQMITFVERNRLKDVISEQDLLQGRLDEKTRAKIKRIFGVEALIMCMYYDDDAGGATRKKLRVRIVDSETGAILGSVITRARDDFGYHCEIAVQALKADLINRKQSEQLAD